MGRHVDIHRRAALLNATATHLVEHGIADVSLDAIATSAQTSSRMLVHHFGTREALITGALEIVRTRQLDDAGRFFVPGPDATTVLKAAWPWFVDSQTCKYFRLFQQVAALEKLQTRAEPSDLRRRLADDWMPMFRAVFAADPRHRDNAGALAELLLAVYRGLAVQLVAKCDETQLRDAYDQFIALLEAQPAPGAPR